MKTETPKYTRSEIQEALRIFIESGSSNGREEFRSYCRKLLCVFAGAPELLEAAKRVIELWDSGANPAGAFQNLKEAIAKAEGKE